MAARLGGIRRVCVPPRWSGVSVSRALRIIIQSCLVLVWESTEYSLSNPFKREENQLIRKADRT